MRFFGLGFFMESSPPWALVLTLKRFYVFHPSHGFIQKNVMSAQWITALTPCPRSESLRWHRVRAVNHCADTVSAQWITALTPCPRSESLRWHHPWTPCPWTPCPWTPCPWTPCPWTPKFIKKISCYSQFTANIPVHRVRAVIHCGDISSENGSNVRAVIHCGDTVSPQWITAGTFPYVFFGLKKFLWP